MRSARFDNVTISKLRGVGSASAAKSVANRHPDRNKLRILMARPLCWTGLLRGVSKADPLSIGKSFTGVDTMGREDRVRPEAVARAARQ